MSDSDGPNQAQLLIETGAVLFLIGLLIGLVVPLVENPRMGLSSHLESLFNGVFLVLSGLIWSRVSLSSKAKQVLLGLLLFGTCANVGATFLAAIWGAGGKMMPIAAGGMEGTAWQEQLIAAMLVALSLAMLAATVLILVGLRRGRRIRT